MSRFGMMERCFDVVESKWENKIISVDVGRRHETLRQPLQAVIYNIT